MPAYRVVMVVTALVLAFPAFGQGVELDLTDKPAVETQYRPTLAFLGVYASGDDVAGQTGRAKMLEDALLKSIENGEGFSKIIAPASAQKAAPQGGFTRCLEWTCVNAAAKAARIRSTPRSGGELVGVGDMSGIGLHQTRSRTN